MASDVAKVYGRALWSLADDEGLEGRFLTELRLLCHTMTEEPAYLSMLSSPSLSIEERCELVSSAWTGRLHSYIVNFLCVLIRSGRISYLSEIITVYVQSYREAMHVAVARVESAVELSPSQIEALRLRLEKKVGGRIEMDLCVDPTLLGGLRVEVAGKRFEGTARAKLDDLRRTLSDTVM